MLDLIFFVIIFVTRGVTNFERLVVLSRTE